MAENNKNFDVGQAIQESVRQSALAHDSIREERVQRLESRIDALSDKLSDLKSKQATIEERVSHLPKKEFIVTSVIISLTAIAAIIGYSDKIKSFFN